MARDARGPGRSKAGHNSLSRAALTRRKISGVAGTHSGGRHPAGRQAPACRDASAEPGAAPAGPQPDSGAVSWPGARDGTASSSVLRLVIMWCSQDGHLVSGASQARVRFGHLAAAPECRPAGPYARAAARLSRMAIGCAGVLCRCRQGDGAWSPVASTPSEICLDSYGTMRWYSGGSACSGHE